jgi:hypothetical protein
VPVVSRVVDLVLMRQRTPLQEDGLISGGSCSPMLAVVVAVAVVLVLPVVAVAVVLVLVLVAVPVASRVVGLVLMRQGTPLQEDCLVTGHRCSPLLAVGVAVAVVLVLLVVAVAVVLVLVLVAVPVVSRVVDLVLMRQGTPLQEDRLVTGHRCSPLLAVGVAVAVVLVLLLVASPLLAVGVAVAVVLVLPVVAVAVVLVLVLVAVPVASRVVDLVLMRQRTPLQEDCLVTGHRFSPLLAVGVAVAVVLVLLVVAVAVVLVLVLVAVPVASRVVGLVLMRQGTPLQEDRLVTGESR